MTNYELASLVAAGSVGAGFVGAPTGMGGGVVIIPMLTLVFGVDLRYAIGASLVSIIATSSGAAAAYVKEGYTNLRVGMFLEVATSLGAVAGAFLGVWLNPSWIAVIFGLALLASARQAWTPVEDATAPSADDWLAARLRLDGAYPAGSEWVPYHVVRVPFGFLLMLVAGAMSGLLGIGSGAVKVLAMDQIMRLPFKVSTTTSNFMIGVTAAASAGVYLSRGYIDPLLATPVTLGVLAGATGGAAVLARTHPAHLRILFALLIAALGVQMMIKGPNRRLLMIGPRATAGIGRAQAAMALLLRLGVVTSALMVVIGGAAFLAAHGAETAQFAVFRGEPSTLRRVPDIAHGAARAEPQSVIMLGLLVLIATPILRVAFSLVLFVFDRDPAFVTITLFVLAVLLFGLLGQHG